MAPACHSRLIRNDYFLNVNVKYDVCCTCDCAKLPNISVPLTVIPLTNPATYGFQQPEDFQSMELGYFKFAIPNAMGVF